MDYKDMTVEDLTQIRTPEQLAELVIHLARRVDELEHAKEYNGYSSFETWVVALWMDNEQGSYNYWQREARFARSTSNLAAQLRVEHQEAVDALNASGFIADLLNAAMREVDWYEIAENLREDYVDDDEDEDTDEEDDDEEADIIRDLRALREEQELLHTPTLTEEADDEPTDS